MRRIRPLAWVLLAAGVALLALSSVLEPTPATHVLERGRTVTVQHDNAVDYAITASRLTGIALLIAGAYLGYRSVRPDELVVDDELPPSTFDRYAGTTLPEHGDPSSLPPGIG